MRSISSTSSSLADIRAQAQLDPALLAGPAATIGIPLANPRTGLPMLDSILSISRQSISSVSGNNSPASSQVSLLSLPDNSIGGGGKRPGVRNGSSTSVGRKMPFILEEVEEDGDDDSVSASGSGSVPSSVSGAADPSARRSVSSMHHVVVPSHAKRSRTFSDAPLVLSGPQQQSGSSSLFGGLARSSSSSRRTASILSLPSSTISATSSTATLSRPRPPLNKYQRGSRTVDVPAYLAPSSTTSASTSAREEEDYARKYGAPHLLARATYTASTNPNRVSSAIELSRGAAGSAKHGLRRSRLGLLFLLFLWRSHKYYHQEQEHVHADDLALRLVRYARAHLAPRARAEYPTRVLVEAPATCAPEAV